ncbi:MAG: hypothetical protein ACJ77K_12590 [Bacteroidia bacterium]
MSFIVIEGEAYILKIHDDNFLEFIVKEDALMDTSVANEVSRILSEYRPGVKYFVLAEGQGVFKVTKELRELCASEVFSAGTYAVAFHTTNPSMKLLGELYININKPVVPTRIFYSRQSAWEWLQEKMAEAMVQVRKAQG